MKNTKPKLIDPGSGRPRKPRAGLPPGGTLPVFSDDEGLAAAIGRLKRAEIRAAEDYRLALSTADQDLVRGMKKNWLDLIESLRRVEQTNPDVEAANAKTIPISTVEADAARAVTVFRLAMESLPKSLPPRLVGKDCAEIQQVLSQAITDALEELHSAPWRIHD